MKVKALIFINKQHTILPDQERVLDLEYGKGNWDFIFVPKEGWTWEQQIEEASHFVKIAGESMKDRGEKMTAVFLSPIPGLLSTLSKIEGRYQSLEVRVFHNDNRVAKELPGGKIVHTVAPTGWILV